MTTADDNLLCQFCLLFVVSRWQTCWSRWVFFWLAQQTLLEFFQNLLGSYHTKSFQILKKTSLSCTTHRHKPQYVKNIFIICSYCMIHTKKKTKKPVYLIKSSTNRTKPARFYSAVHFTDSSICPSEWVSLHMYMSFYLFVHLVVIWSVCLSYSLLVRFSVRLSVSLFLRWSICLPYTQSFCFPVLKLASLFVCCRVKLSVSQPTRV